MVVLDRIQIRHLPRTSPFLQHGAVRYAFSMSADRILRSFSAASNRQMRTESRDTTVLYVTEAGVSVLCPSATSRALRRKFSPSLISKTKCVVISCHPTRVVGSLSYFLTASRIFFISISMALCQNRFPSSLSIAYASSTDLGTRMPYLCVRCQYLDLIFANIEQTSNHHKGNCKFCSTYLKNLIS